MKRFLPDVNTLPALAVANGAGFAAFDTRVPAAAVAGGSAALEAIPVS